MISLNYVIGQKADSWEVPPLMNVTDTIRSLSWSSSASKWSIMLRAALISISSWLSLSCTALKFFLRNSVIKEDITESNYFVCSGCSFCLKISIWISLGAVKLGYRGPQDVPKRGIPWRRDIPWRDKPWRFRKYSTLLVFQLFSWRLCLYLCHCLCLCICVLLWLLNSFHHKLSEYV